MVDGKRPGSASGARSAPSCSHLSSGQAEKQINNYNFLLCDLLQSSLVLHLSMATLGIAPDEPHVLVSFLLKGLIECVFVVVVCFFFGGGLTFCRMYKNTHP